MILLETRQAGDRKRERWLLDLAAESAARNWPLREARVRASTDVSRAFSYGHIQTFGSITNAVAEGTLAAHPAVRSEVSRLCAVRDEVWKLDPDYLRKTLHGPSQILIDLMRRQKQPNERQYAANAQAYLGYLRTHRFPNR